MHVYSLEDSIETELRGAVTTHFPYDWKEDSITHDLMIRLRRQFGNITIEGLRFPINIAWEIYKQHGTVESDHGDIGVLIRYRMPNGDLVEGAGFLEAKARDRKTAKFLQIRKKQVARILRRSCHTRLVLYDYDDVCVLDGAYPAAFRALPGAYALVTNAPVLPLQLAASVGQYDSTLYRFCHSFSHQFTRRYFQLHDLDFAPSAISAVKGFPVAIRAAPSILMVIQVAPQGQEPPESFFPNADVYGLVG